MPWLSSTLAATVAVLLLASTSSNAQQSNTGSTGTGRQVGAATTQPSAGPTTRQRWRREPRTLHVAPSGDDANDGSQAKPFRTIQKGCDSVGAGDTLVIAGGTYSEYVTLNNSGRYFAGNQITIKAADGEQVIIDGGAPLQKPAPRSATGPATRQWNPGPRPGHAAIFDTNGQDHVKIIGITVQNGGFCGIRIGSSWQVDVENCKSDGTPGSGIIVDKSGMVNVRNCEVTRACGGDGTAEWGGGNGEESISVKRSTDVTVENTHVHHSHHEGIDVKEGSKHVRVRNNHVHHIERQALYADAWDSPTYDIRFENNVVHDCMFGLVVGAESGGLLSDVWFVNNVVYNLRGPGMIVQDWGGDRFSNPCKDIYFVNNTVHNTGGGGRNGGWGGAMVFESDQAENVVVVNNILSGSPQNQLRVANGKLPKSYTVRNNLINGPTDQVGEGHITGDPMFADPQNGDFTLRAGSPAIDKGIGEFAPETDMNGQSRPAGRAIDVGAYERP